MQRTNSWKRPWCWERLRAGGEGSNRGCGGWMASPTQWLWVWANSGRHEGQGSLACCNTCGHNVLDMTEWLQKNRWYLAVLCKAGARNAAKHPTMTMTSCTTKNYLVQNANNSTAETTWTRTTKRIWKRTTSDGLHYLIPVWYWYTCCRIECKNLIVKAVSYLWHINLIVKAVSYLWQINFLKKELSLLDLCFT